MFPEKSCISLKGRQRPLGTEKSHSRNNGRAVAAVERRNHRVNSNENGILKTNLQNASSVVFTILAAALVSQPTSVLAR